MSGNPMPAADLALPAGLAEVSSLPWLLVMGAKRQAKGARTRHSAASHSLATYPPEGAQRGLVS